MHSLKINLKYHLCSNKSICLLWSVLMYQLPSLAQQSWSS